MPQSILIVDDERDANEALKMFLEMRGFSVRCATSGQEGVDAVKEAQPDLVLLDLAMPFMDGWKTLKSMREVSPDLRVSILTGSVPDSDLEEQAKQKGAIGFITKPIQVQGLPAQIKALLSVQPGGFLSCL